MQRNKVCLVDARVITILPCVASLSQIFIMYDCLDFRGFSKNILERMLYVTLISKKEDTKIPAALE